MPATPLQGRIGLMASAHRYRVPLLRVGLTLTVGGFIVALVRAYVALGESAANLSGPDPIPVSRDQFLAGVRETVLRGPGLPHVLFLVGAGLTFLGVLRLLFRAGKRAFVTTEYIKSRVRGAQTEEEQARRRALGD